MTKKGRFLTFLALMCRFLDLGEMKEHLSSSPPPYFLTAHFEEQELSLPTSVHHNLWPLIIESGLR